MKKEIKKEQILNILSEPIRKLMIGENLRFQWLQEIRLRINQKIVLHYRGREYIPESMQHYVVSNTDMKEMLEYVSEYSLYAYERELRQGYITIEGGHRVGLAGKAVMEAGCIKNLKYISSMNIRISHEVMGCADILFPYLVQGRQMGHTLLISPPRCGKTTILRDLIRQISDGNEWMRGSSVGVVDERSELGGCYHGVPQNNLGGRTDILDACPKVEGMIMLVRSMAPEVVVVDEIGGEEDVRAIEYVIRCGCKFIGSIHGTSLEEIRQKPVMKRLLESRTFERFVELYNVPKVGSIRGIYDGNGNALF